MRISNFRCAPCQQAKYDAEAAAQGATIIGPGRSNIHRTYRLECGHEQSVEMGAMRNGHFLCQICEETARSLPSYVYLLRIKNGTDEWLKFGFAKNVDTRIARYGLPNTATAEQIAAVRFDTGAEAHFFEQAVHERHKTRKLSQRKAEKFGMAKSGSTECYPVTMRATLEMELLR